MINLPTGLFDLVPASDVAKGKWWQRGIYLVQGCSKVSAGCLNCWSETYETGRCQRDFSKINPRWDRIKELGRGAPQLWSVWNDLFHPAVPDGFIIEVLDRMCSWRWPSKAAERAGDESALVDPGHGYLILTKRPERINPWVDWVGETVPGDTPFNVSMESPPGWPEHVWVGTSVEGPEQIGRIEELLRAPVAGRFVSFEPLLGGLSLDRCLGICKHWKSKDGRNKIPWHPEDKTKIHYKKQGLVSVDYKKIDWVIIGAESGANRRECKIEWVRDLVRQCKAADVPVFVKQLHINGKVEKDINNFPKDLRIREFPGKG